MPISRRKVAVTPRSKPEATVLKPFRYVQIKKSFGVGEDSLAVAESENQTLSKAEQRKLDSDHLRDPLLSELSKTTFASRKMPFSC